MVDIETIRTFRVHTQTHTNTHTHCENDRSSCWRDLEVMLDHNTEEKNKFFNPGGCLRCELLDHMVTQGYECFCVSTTINSHYEEHKN